MAEPPQPSPEDPASRREPLLARLVGAGARGGIRGAGRMAEATGIDRALEEAAEEAVVRALDSPAAERAIARALESTAVERSLVRVIDSEMVDRVWERLLVSDEIQKTIERIATAPEIRQAIAYQGVGLIDDVGAQVGRVARRLDAAVERFFRALFRRPRRVGDAECAGVVTRLLAFALDTLIVNGGLLLASTLLALLLNAVFDPTGDADAGALAVGGFIWALTGSTYLVTFWGLSGETPGMRFLDLRLHGPEGPRLGFRLALRRLVGTVLAALPLGLGFVRILFDERRRGFNDRFAGTEVRYLPPRREAPWTQGAPTAPAPPS